VQLDRRKGETIDEAGVVATFGVSPASIPDYLGLVGDSADGFPGLPGWGAKGAGAVLARYGHVEAIPSRVEDWNVPGLRGAARLAETLDAQRDLALLFRKIATLVADIDVGTVDDWRWTGPTERFPAMCERLGATALIERAERLAVGRD
jgi:5'-3' exonuclease